MSAELLVFVVVLTAMLIAISILNWLENKINSEPDE